MAALAGGGAGALAGGIVGGLVGLGVPEPVAADYQQALYDGGAVISVATRPEDADEIVDLMTQKRGRARPPARKRNPLCAAILS